MSRCALEEARDLGVPMWLGANVVEMWHMGIVEGHGEEDFTALIKMFEKWAGVVVGGNESGPTRVIARAGERTESAWGTLDHAALGAPLRGEMKATALRSLSPTYTLRRKLMNRCCIRRVHADVPSPTILR